MSDHLADLSDEQLTVAKTTTGMRFVVACPGGGKTKVLVSSIAELIAQGKPPSSILAFTFTKAAAEEMTSRLEAAVGPSSASMLTVGTMHSIFFRCLRDHPDELERTEFRVLDGRRAEHKQMLRKILKKQNASEEEYPIIDLVKHIGRIKNEGLKPRDDASLDFLINERDLPVTYAQLVLDVFSAYESEKWDAGVIDFDDMLTLTLDLFRAFPEVAQSYAQRWAYIFVDETHDINPVQNELIKILVSGHKNLFAVCDPNQSIYGFRGAHPDIVLTYGTHYRGAIIQRLTRNFRSRQEIVDRSYELIHHNDNPLEITSYSEKPGGFVDFQDEFDSVNDEAAWVGESITARLKEGAEPRDFFILFRTNAQSRAPEESMVRNRLPYRLLGMSSFYSRREIQDTLAYLQFASDPDGFSEAFERIYNKPNRFLGKAWYREYSNQLCDKGNWRDVLLHGTWSKPYMKRGAVELRRQLMNIIAFHNTAQDDSSVTLGDIGRHIVKTVKYEEYCRREDEDSNDRVNNLHEFLSTIDRFDTVNDLMSYISAVTDSLQKSERGDNKITLATMHKSKGLEAKIVFVIGMAEGLLPHAKANDIDEERRLAFVAVSRGEEEVYLTAPAEYRNIPMVPSRFLYEMGVLDPPSEGQMEDARPHSEAVILPESCSIHSRNESLLNQLRVAGD